LIAVDSNILVYAHRRDAAAHAAARRVVRGLVESPAPWALPWPCVHEFLAIATNARIFREPSPLDVALRAVEDLLDEGNAVLLAEGDDHLERLAGLLRRGGISGGAVHDARIAAICLSHGVNELWSADRDFGRFPDLRVRNPLV
jgi:toxin-antitoxin system PIN domain toxin